MLCVLHRVEPSKMVTTTLCAAGSFSSCGEHATGRDRWYGLTAFLFTARRKEMSTLWHCNKERERNTHLRVKEASWNIASLLSYLKSGGSAPPLTLRRLILVVRFGVLATQFGVSPCVGVANSRRHKGGGVAWIALSQAFPQTQEISFLALSP